MVILNAVRNIVQSGRCSDVPMSLEELADNNRCAPIHLRYGAEAWALRLNHNDHLPILAELPAEKSVRRLPDYLVFCASPSTDDLKLRILVCELKSGAIGAQDALRQLRLGKLLAEYLLRIAAHAINIKDAPEAWCCGLIASPEFPQSLMAKGRTRPGKVELPNSFDSASRMRYYMAPAGTEVRLESVWGG